MDDIEAFLFQKNIIAAFRTVHPKENSILLAQGVILPAVQMLAARDGAQTVTAFIGGEIATNMDSAGVFQKGKVKAI